MSDFDLRRSNALSCFRLFLATLVIVSHSPELIDGNSGREWLKSIFGTLTSGQVAVYGFFFISGYLVVDSALRSSVYAFMFRRTMRIVPGYVVAYLLSITVVFWLGGGEFSELSPSNWAVKLSKMAFLLNPAQIGSAFAGSHTPDVNGSLWTIAYEFRCYILAAIVVFCLGYTTLAFAGIASALGLVLLFGVSKGISLQYEVGHFEPIGNVDDSVRFTMMFAIGAVFQLQRERVRSDGRVALACFLLLLWGMSSERWAPIVVGVCGGYLLLYLAFLGARNPLNALNRKNDISYGVYLYAWPIQKLLIMHVPGISPAQLTMMTVPLAFCAGFLSWHLVEKAAVRWSGPQLTQQGCMKHQRLSP
jgi:peptidoglycan/LPS O-acetylase OafA/YrhL